VHMPPYVLRIRLRILKPVTAVPAPAPPGRSSCAP
jgi:hypothetical protein